jgi:hypothetical protein
VRFRRRICKNDIFAPPWQAPSWPSPTNFRVFWQIPPAIPPPSPPPCRDFNSANPSFFAVSWIPYLKSITCKNFSWHTGSFSPRTISGPRNCTLCTLFAGFSMGEDGDRCRLPQRSLSGFRENFRSDSRGADFRVTHCFRGRSREEDGSGVARFCPVLSGSVRFCLDLGWPSRNCLSAAERDRVDAVGPTARARMRQRKVCERPPQLHSIVKERGRISRLRREAGCPDAVFPPIDYRFRRGRNEPPATSLARRDAVSDFD